MRYIATDPNNDYIFVSDFEKLADHLHRLINQACRTDPPTTLTPSPPPTTTVVTPTPTLPYCKPDDVDTTQPSEGRYTIENDKTHLPKFHVVMQI